jgi:hypothetical protein
MTRGNMQRRKALDPTDRMLHFNEKFRKFLPSCDFMCSNRTKHKSLHPGARFTIIGIESHREVSKLFSSLLTSGLSQQSPTEHLIGPQFHLRSNCLFVLSERDDAAVMQA